MYVTNVVKVWVKPKAADVKVCGKHLQTELELVRPELVIAMGDVAAKWFDKGVRLGRHHGIGREVTKGDWSGRVVPMYHPAYALRNANVWPVLIDDFRLLWERVGPHEPMPKDYRLVELSEVLRYVSGD